MSKLIAVRRQLLPSDHQTLREHMPSFNRRMSDITLKWRNLGKVGLTLIERGEYQRALEKKQGNLTSIGAAVIEAELNTTFIPSLPDANQRMDVPVIGVDFFGTGRFLSVAYLLEPDRLVPDWQKLTAYVDERNGVNNSWGEFRPHVSLATMDRLDAEDRVLDAFDDIAPDSLRLMQLRASTT